MKRQEKHTNKKLKQLSDQHEVPFNNHAWERMEALLDDNPSPPEKSRRAPLLFTTLIANSYSLSFFITCSTSPKAPYPKLPRILNMPILNFSLIKVKN